MKVYLAAQFHQKDEINEYATQLRAAGIFVTSSWLDEPFAPNTQLGEVNETTRREYAQRDLLDIDEANLLVFFSIPDTQLFRRGGRHVEFGYALAKNIPILVVGPQENIFHSLDDRVKHFAAWGEALAALINQSAEATGR